MLTGVKSDFTSYSSEESPEMLMRGRKFPAGNPIPDIGRMEENITFDDEVERKVKRAG